MKAIQINRTGGPEVLEYVDLPRPKAGEGQAVVQVKAAGENFTDIYTRTGMAHGAPLPCVLGVEAAGVVVEVGPGVTGVQPGDRVAYSSGLGSYAEYAVQPVWRLMPVATGVSFETAAAAMLQGMTAQYLSHDCYPIKAGDVALIHAGAGGVGQLLIQMAKQLGATVIATVSTEAKAAIAKACGADHVIRYTVDDFEAETMRITGGKGVHVVYDSVGKDTFAKGMNLLDNRGYMICYGQSSGWPDPVSLQTLNIKGTFVSRPSLVHYTTDRHEIALRSGAVFNAIAAGRLKVDITKTFPLAEAAEAHRQLEGRATTGKLLLIP